MEQVITDGWACKAKIIESISKAQFTVKVAMAYFTDKEIADELIAAKDRGIDVKVVLANETINNEIKDRLTGKVSIILFESNGRGIMHHKFCIIDKSLLLHGSYNYTYNATKNNQESLNITDSYTLISEYTSIFDTLSSKAMDANKDFNEELKPKSIEADMYLENFTTQLKNHISRIFDEYNHEEIKEEGKKLAEENQGERNVFVAYLDTSLARVKTIFRQEDQTKTIVKNNMKGSFENTIESNQKNLETDLQSLNNHCQEKKSIIQSEIENTKNRKNLKQKEYNEINAGLNIVNDDIFELQDEIDNLDRQIVVKKFWTFPTVLKLILTTLFFFYLCLFFSSSIWKIFFEEVEVLNFLSRGVTPEPPPIFDADALVNIFSKKGVFFGAVSAFFFLVPVLLTSIKLLSNTNKFIEIFVGWIIGIFAIDVVVAILLSQHTFEIKRLLVGGSEKWELTSAFSTPDFWLIFIFGAFPLFLTKILLENIDIAYRNSNPESVDHEKTKLRKFKRRMLVEKEQEKRALKVNLDTLSLEIDELNSTINNFEDEINNISSYENNKKQELNERAEKKNRNIRETYNSFISIVESGNNQFLKHVIDGRISAFKTGYYNFLNSFYAPKVAADKIEILETALQQWENQNFQ